MWHLFGEAVDLHQGAILLSAFVLSVIHGIVPNHWLPFVLVARVQRWSTARTLWVAFAATSVHLAVTGILAGLLMGAGSAFLDTIRRFSHVLPGIVMLAAGSVLVGLELLGVRHPHRHLHAEAATGFSDAAAVISLVMMLALSPCEALAAVFVSAIPFYSLGFFVAVVFLAGVTTLAVIEGLVLATLKGLVALDSRHLLKRERTVIGATLLLLGALTLAVGLHH